VGTVPGGAGAGQGFGGIETGRRIGYRGKRERQLGASQQNSPRSAHRQMVERATEQRCGIARPILLDRGNRRQNARRQTSAAGTAQTYPAAPRRFW
jgi:hypothetical protein